MTKIECILRPGKLEAVTDALAKFGIRGMTAIEVIGCGMQKGHTQAEKGAGYNINLLPKTKIELVINDKYVDEVVRLITETSRTGEIGDGKIFVYPVGNAVRIRTGETGESAI
ncbi:MAG: P-II family nitrogen regulator [Peptococcaceae bacterium]|nr:P-II family nitrogen regulator [Peptococcaceae bacterium]